MTTAERGGGIAGLCTVTAALGEFSVESLGGSGTRNELMLGCSFAQTIRYYLADRGSGRPGWPYPRFRRGPGHGSSSTAEAEFHIDVTIWDELSQEAARQAVPPNELLQHAILYFLADRDVGRVAQRVLASLGEMRS